MATDILQWEYDAPYDLYNNELSDEALKELLDGSYYSIVDGCNNLIGFFCIGENAKVPIGNRLGVYQDNFVDIGLGMHPSLVGKGNGFEFCSFIIKTIEEKYEKKPIRLTVAKFNIRATRLYEKLGFVSENAFSNDTTTFLTMIKKDS